MLESLAKIVWADAGAAGITRRRGCPETTLVVSVRNIATVLRTEDTIPTPHRTQPRRFRLASSPLRHGEL